MFPVFKRVSFDRFPLTGSSRFAVQTMVLLWLIEFGVVNHMAKEYAFSPMAIKPAENIPFGEMIVSCGFSTEREEPFLNDDEEEGEVWNNKAKTRRNSVNEKSRVFMDAMSEEAFHLVVDMIYGLTQKMYIYIH